MLRVYISTGETLPAEVDPTLYASVYYTTHTMFYAADLTLTNAVSHEQDYRLEVS